MKTDIIYNETITCSYIHGNSVTVSSNTMSFSHTLRQTDHCVFYEITELKNQSREIQKSWTFIIMVDEFQKTDIDINM